MKFSSKLFSAVEFVVKNSKVHQPFPPLPTVSELVKLYKVHATKQLSQNFLYNPSIINRFLKCLRPSLEGYHVCEVGPGPGSITRGILQSGVEHLTIVEKDHRFLPILQYIADVVGDRLSIVHGDILTFDISDCFPSDLAASWNSDCPPFCVYGNLPFNISLPLLFNWLDLISRKDGLFKLGRIPLVLTFQCEVAQRLIAQPRSRQRSRISVTTQFYCDVTHHFSISGGSFVPPPKVFVGAVKLIPKKEADITLPFKEVDKVVKHLLSGHKNKPCQFGVSTLFPRVRTDLVEEMFRISGVFPQSQSTKLENHHFRDLCYAFDEISQRIPQLKLVDTYDPKVWKKHFDERGNPILSTPKSDPSDEDSAKAHLCEFLHSDVEYEGAEERKSRRHRKRLNRLFYSPNSREET